MPDDNQIEIAQSFIAMYVAPGRSSPNAPREVVLARYEQCEDMALTLVEPAQIARAGAGNARLSADILRALKTRAEASLGQSVERAVITVPA